MPPTLLTKGAGARFHPLSGVAPVWNPLQSSHTAQTRLGPHPRERMDGHGRGQSEALNGQGFPDHSKGRETRHFALGRARARFPAARPSRGPLPSTRNAPAGTARALPGMRNGGGCSPTCYR